MDKYDVIVVGGGPSGATAANDLALHGKKVLLLDKDGRIKPCGGAIPPRLVRDFEIPDELLRARIRSARMISPKGKSVDMPIENGYVGMVDREVFDEWLRNRAQKSGATRLKGEFVEIARGDNQELRVIYRDNASGDLKTVESELLIGADGARSKVLRQGLPKVKPAPCVFAYHEIIESPEMEDNALYEPTRCDVYYQGKLSPDFYAWVFPHGKTASVGVGSAKKGFSLRGAVEELRKDANMQSQTMIRHEGAPIPMKPIKKWDNGKDIILAGDAAGVVAPASGEGIYYAMACGRMVADAALQTLKTGDASNLAAARKTFIKEHGKVFWVLGLLQYFWYGGDFRREQFVKICEDKDVQRLTWESYMNKELVKREPMAHLRVFVKDLGHLLGFAKV
ncbi:MAG: geranylgeranyl diphosphate reductase [Rhizobiaceae bacterium]|nr:geranylgeranyl diphosphate reductase [Rhizobiaceae bacterium]